MLKNKNILKIITVFTVLLMSMYMLTGCEIRKSDSDKKKEETASYEEPIKNMVEGLSEANSKKFLNAFPAFISDYMEDIFTDEYLEGILEQAEEEYGKNVTMSYKVKDKEEIKEDDLRDVEKEIEENFDKKIEITKGYKLDLEITTKGDDEKDTEEDVMSVYEIDGKWYILDIT